MTSLDDLIQTYAASPEDLFSSIDQLSAQERHDLIVQNVARRLPANHLDTEEGTIVLPREYRRQGGVRWDHFGYVLRYFDAAMLEHHLLGHLAIEKEDPKATYMRNLLAMLAWMSIDHSGDSQEGTAVSTRSEKRRSHRG